MPTTHTSRDAAQALAFSRGIVEPSMRAAVDSLADPLRHLSGYHLGWWDETGAPEARGAGKAIRPALVLLSAQAMGADPHAAVSGAAAVELVHNHSILHDDVIDGDRTRRHRPTVWSAFGVGPAILAGDALLTLAFDVLRDAAHPCPSTTLATAVQHLLRGQCADVAFETRNDVSLDECVAMAQDKTGALFACACVIGGQVAGADHVRLEGLRGFGQSLGLAFQLIDDLLGIWGDPVVTGKPVYSDLRSRKKSLPVVAALTSGTPAERRLAGLCADPQADPATMAELVERAGGHRWAHAHAQLSLERALRDLRPALPDPAPAAELIALAHLVTERRA